MGIAWTRERVDLLRALWADGIPAGQIAKRMGITRGMVAGKRHSLGLPPRDQKVQIEAMVANAKRTAVLCGHLGKLQPEYRAGKRTDVESKMDRLSKPLEGSNPRPWTQRTYRECAFPVAGYGEGTLSCCLPNTLGSPYCLGHREILAGRQWPPEDAAPGLAASQWVVDG